MHKRRLLVGPAVALLLVLLLSSSCGRAQRASGDGLVVLVCASDMVAEHWRVSLQVSRLDSGTFAATRILLETEKCVLGPRLSPDGAQVVFAMTESPDCADNPDIFLIPTSGGEPVNLTHHPARDVQPSWSPEGKRVAFYSSREPSGIYTMDSNGSHVARLPTGVTSYEADPAWSPDGTQIAFVSDVEVALDGGETILLPEIFVVAVDGSYRRQVTDNLTEERMPTWSPDGKGLIFLRRLPPTLLRYPSPPTSEGYAIGGLELGTGSEYLVREAPAGYSYEFLSWSRERQEVLVTARGFNCRQSCQYLLPRCEACAAQKISCEGYCAEADW